MEIKIKASSIWMATECVDFRKSIDGLCMTIIDRLQKKPQDGVFIFYNRKRDKVKIISRHRNGYMMIYKRFEQCKLKCITQSDERSISVDEKHTVGCWQD